MRALKTVRHVPVVLDRPCSAVPPTFRRPSVRCLSKRRDSENKSWADLAEDAIDVAKAALGKLIPKGEKKKSSSKVSKSRPKEDEEYGIMAPGFLGGLVGRAMGQMMNTAFQAIGQQLAETRQQAKDVYGIASDRVLNSPEIRQESDYTHHEASPKRMNSQSINGVVTKRTKLEFPVSGQMGSGVVQVDARENSQRREKVNIKVRLQSGRVIHVDDDSKKGMGGRTIDVEWKDI